MKKLAASIVIAIASAFNAVAAGFDGMNLVTNAWFAANFTTGLAEGSAIVANSATGVTVGAGSWTTVPATGTAVIAADEDAGGGATMLSVNAPGEELVLTPSAYASPSGLETFASEVKGEAIEELPSLDATVQGAFTIYDDGAGNVSAAGWTSAGWTNFTYAASGLTNAWFTLYADFATIDGLRYVRYSVKPAAGAVSVLVDSAGTSWFRAARDVSSVTSVSLSGIADVRTLSGDELTRVPVATYDGTDYPTIADAIAAADEGGTITLLKGVTEDALSIAKDITLDFAEFTTSIPYISIASGKTLTLKRANKQNKIGYFTGGGNLVVANGKSFRWEGMTGTSSLASITQSDASNGISISGYGTINVSGDVNVAGTLTLTPGRITSSTVNDEYTIKLSAKSLAAKTLNGGATVETADGATVTSGTFYGKFTGTGALNASGGFTLEGVDAVSSKLNVKSGTVSVATRNPSAGWRLDASDTSNMTITDGDIVSFTTPNGNNVRTWASQGTAYATIGTDEDYFDGKQVMFFKANAEYEYSSGNLRYGTYFAVYQKNEDVSASDAENVLLTSKNSPANDKLRFGIYKKNYQNRSTWYGWSNSSSQAPNYTWPIFLDGSNASKNYTAGKKSVLSFASYLPDSGSRGIQLGNAGATFVGAVAEIIGLDSAVSLEERSAIEYYLMKKWNCTDAGNFVQLADTTDVAVDSGATLDLGGYSHTVASFTGGGTVQNGTLITADNVYTNTGALSITAVDDMTVVLDAGATALTLVGDATNVSVTATEAFIGSGATITVTASDIHTAGHAIDFSGIPSDIFRYGYIDNDDGTWTVGVQTSGYTAATYTWSPVGNSTDWTSAANWKVGEQSVAVIPQSVDSVVFPATEGDAVNAIELASNVSIVSFTVNGDTRISGASIIVLGTLQSQETNNDNYGTVNITGDGKIILGANGGIRARQAQYQSETVNIQVPEIVIEGTAENPSYLVGHLGSSSKMATTYVKATSNITGSGYVKIGARRGSWDMTAAQWKDFTGHVTVHDDGISRDGVRFTTSSDIDSLVGSKWCLADANTSFIPKNTAYTFGELTGSPYITESGTTVNVGGANTDFTVTGNYGNNATINKQGTGTMTFNGVRVKALGLEAGIVKVTNPRAFHYLPYYYKDSKNAKQTGESLTVVQWEEDKASHAEEYTQDATPKYTTITFKGGTLELATGLEDFDFSAQILNSTAAIAVDLPESRTWSSKLDSTNKGGLVKKGEGTLTLKAEPEYEGDTVLEEGILKIVASANKRVIAKDKEHYSVYKTTETIEGVEYYVYKLGPKQGSVLIYW